MGGGLNYNGGGGGQGRYTSNFCLLFYPGFPDRACSSTSDIYCFKA